MSSYEIDEIYKRLGDDLEIEPPKLGHSNIRQFYAGKAIFFTGATGFMGKGFVEKVLKDCPDLRKLYLLIRPSRGASAEERTKKYFQSFVFDKLRSIYPKFEDKVVAISGDLQEERLGISDEDRQTLIDDVDIMIHNGATVKFDEKISVSLKINVMGTKYMLDLGMECKHIQAFMYVSTAYSHCYIRHIEEKFYDPPGDFKMVQDIIHSDVTAKHGLSDEALTMLLGKWPNTYTFTKAMAEGLVQQYGKKVNFACGVYRPSIVTAAVKDPLPGWVGNKGGPTAIFVGVGLGAIHSSYNEGYPIDLIPLDYSINALLTSVYDLTEQWENDKEPRVYNCGSSTISPITLEQKFKHLVAEVQIVGTTRAVWAMSFTFSSTRLMFYVLHILFHFFPALFADLALLAMGKKPRALSIFWFATKHLKKVNYFANGNWRIHVTEMMRCLKKLTPTDKLLFPYDLTDFNWEDFTRNYVRGGRVYLLQEPLDNVVEGRRHVQRLQILHNVIKTIFYLILVYYATRFYICLIGVA